MLRTSLRLARGTAGRLVAAGVAIVVGTAFVAAVLLASGLFKATVSAAVSASYAGADVVIRATGNALDEAAVARVRAVPGVTGADGQISSSVQLLAGSRSEWAPLANVLTTPALQHHDVVRGAAPTSGQVALSQSLADRLKVGVGSQVLARVASPGAVPDADGNVPLHDVPITVSGILAGGADSALGLSGTALATTADAVTWVGQPPGAGTYTVILAVASGGTTATQLRDRIHTALSGHLPDGATVDVRTAQQVTDQTVDESTGGTDVLTGVVLAFAVLALFVAGIVITNTFSVLVAQRTRQLALLRCVGATSAQVRRGILGEAAFLGLVASVVGTAAGTALAEAAAAVLHRTATGVPVPGAVAPTLASVLAPVLLGVLATLLAALAPAAAATRVSPLAALRPAGAPDLRTPASRLRLAAALVLVVVGAAGLAGGVALATAGSSFGIAVAMLGGALSFLGVLLGAVLVVPATVGAFGRLAAVVGGGPARVAAANAVRNPRRTTSTTSALLIGVTLVSLMTVGAASTQRTLDGMLDRQYPVDVAVGADDDPIAALAAGESVPPAAATALPAAVAPAVRAVDGVRRVVALTSTRVLVRGGSTSGGSSGDAGYAVTVRGVDPAAARGVVADPQLLAPLRSGVLVAPRPVAERMGLVDGHRATVLDGGVAAAMTVRVTDTGGAVLYATGTDVAQLDPAAATTRLWVALDPAGDVGAAAEDVRDAVAAATGPDTAVPVEGSAVERASYQKTIDTLLAVVVALLAVAVLIALIGVANTLSLSVIERTRESALLRALGLTRGQLRGMLALEGALVAGVGGLLGVVLGTVYGWSGSASLLGGFTRDDGAALALPAQRLGLVLAVAVAAGLLASVLPGRRAARTPPVAALGSERPR